VAGKFDPNQTGFAKGLAHIKGLSKKLGFALGERIVTSWDKGMERLRGLLAVGSKAIPRRLPEMGAPRVFRETQSLAISLVMVASVAFDGPMRRYSERIQMMNRTLLRSVSIASPLHRVLV
jgi:hypothetical protein